MSCGYKHEESEQVTQYKLAVQVMKELKKEGKLDEICKVKALAIPLSDNIVGLIWGNAEVDLAYGKLKYFVPKKFEVVLA